MILSKKTKFTLNTLSAIVVVLVIFLVSCKKKNEAAPNNPSDDNNVFVAVDAKLYVEHTKTVSPCPHNIGQASVVCAEDANEPCKVDSAVIVNSHPSLLAAFSSTSGMISKLEKNKQETIFVAFNCNANETFSHTYKVNLYLKGQLVKNEEFEVTVVVL